MDTQTDARTDNPKPICPFDFFEVGGIIIYIPNSQIDMAVSYKQSFTTFCVKLPLLLMLESLHVRSYVSCFCMVMHQFFLDVISNKQNFSLSPPFTRMHIHITAMILSFWTDRSGQCRVLTVPNFFCI